MKFLTLILAAVLTLTLALPAEAGLTWAQKGIFKSQMLVGKLANCLAKADANVTKGKRVDTGPDDGKCIAKYFTAWAKNRNKALGKGADEGEDMSACEAATTDAMRDGALVATLLGADRELSTFGLDASDLLADAAIQEAVDDAVAAVDITSDNASLCTNAGGTYNSSNNSCSVDITSDNATLCTNAGGTYNSSNNSCSVDITSDNATLCTNAGGTYNSGNNSCSVDITSNDQTVCEDAGGSWEGSACTAGSSYNCTAGSMCSYWAAAYPGDLWRYTNDYVGDTHWDFPHCDMIPWIEAEDHARIPEELYYSTWLMQFVCVSG